MSIFVYKIIALISMLCDHTGEVLFHNVMFLRFIGRIGYIIYAFFIVQGVIHTHDIKKYFKKILLLAFLSEIPFNLAFNKSVICLGSTNVLFLFVIFIVAFITDNKFKERGKDYTYYIILVFGLITLFVNPDGNIAGYSVLWIQYYACKNSKKRIMDVKYLIPQALVMALYEIPGHFIAANKGFVDYLITENAYIFLGLPIAVTLLYFYNGEKGHKSKWIDRIYYMSYPVHLVVLYMIALII